jgi:hypothetical protein
MVANEAFLLYEGKKVYGMAVPFVEEGMDGVRCISLNGGYCFGPCINTDLSYQEQEKIGKKMMEQIERLAEKYQVRECKLRLDPLVNPKQKNTFYNYNFLLKYNYLDYSSLTQLIDLTESETELYAKVRKGHKSDIKRGARYEIEFYDAANITREKIEEYKQIYEMDAGRVTRNSELYLHYLTFIEHGFGILALAKFKKEYVAAMIVTMYGNTAYYSSYGELTERLEKIPVGHVLQWQMIQKLKERGIETYEMGEQVFGPTHEGVPEEKLKAISRFKRGFGGYTVPLWRGIQK